MSTHFKTSFGIADKAPDIRRVVGWKSRALVSAQYLLLMRWDQRQIGLIQFLHLLTGDTAFVVVVLWGLNEIRQVIVWLSIPVACWLGDLGQIACLHSFFISCYSSVIVMTLCAPRTAACQASLTFTISWICSNSCPLSQWCHPTILSSVASFSSCSQSFPSTRVFFISIIGIIHTSQVCVTSSQ